MKLLGADWKGEVVSVIGEVEMDVNTIIKKLKDGSQSSTSQDLAKLRDAGLVSTRRDGLRVIYRLSEIFSETLNNLGDPKTAIQRHRALNKGVNRKKIIEFLRENPETLSKNICPGLDRSIVSHELRILREAGVAEFRKEKAGRFYSLS